MRLRGADLEAIWRAIAKVESAELLRVEGPDGERVEIRIE